jgi:tRNA(Ile2) C34 agmatinyltransferase TiaS|tara:strand:- start:183 stop:362 length:180 start_codon:yes stop_codon:yes gene_type:complete
MIMVNKIKIRRVISKKKKLCPQCLKEVKSTSNLGGWLLPQEYSCNSCGYFGSIALEDDN